MTDKLVIEDNIHTSAAALIIAAAEKSGLLREVAGALYCFEYGLSVGVCCSDGPVALRDRLADAFDDHVCMAGSLVEDYFGEGFSGDCTDAQAAPYLNPPTKDAA